MGGGPVQVSGPSPGQPWGTLVPLSLNIQAVKWGHTFIGSGDAYIHLPMGSRIGDWGWGGRLSQD